MNTKEAIRKKTISDMKKMGTYRAEYNRVIDVYSEIVSQYISAVAEFEKSGCLYETETAAGNPKKSAIVSTMEVLRKDILLYSDRLCLNPKAYNGIKIEEMKTSKLEEALKEFSKK